jgi:type IV pilus assembly protein PilB
MSELPISAPQDTQQVHDILLAQGLITPEQYADALAEARVKQTQPVSVLIENGYISKRDAFRAGVEAAGMEYLELQDYFPDPEAVALVTGDQARKYGVIPVQIRDGKVIVAADPKTATDWQKRDDLTTILRRPIEFVIAQKADINQKLNVLYRAEAELGALVKDLLSGDENAVDVDAEVAVGEDAPLIRYVNLILTQAIADGASDIHVEPSESTIRIRYRIDGVLKEMAPAPKEIQASVISRLKIMSDMDIGEKRKPQDGRLSVLHEGRKIDLRVNCLPTVWGEKVVMRILDNSTATMSLQQLGFAQHNFERWRESYIKPYGMLLVVGPTGSGKSTTLYATLNAVSKPEVNIITVEDPVEYRIPGINQVQVQAKAGMTFAAALRAILRADPDIVLIGEIRDHETAQIAVEAALTGHLVLSTLHTNDAPGAVTRLTEMGIEPFLVGSALDCVLGQRLARRLCGKCKEPYEPEPDDLTSVNFEWFNDEPPTFHRAVGCTACANTGYKGRVALHEVMTMSEEIEKLAIKHASAEEMAKVAREQGMRTLRQDGWLKAGLGITTLGEVLRVVA